MKDGGTASPKLNRSRDRPDLYSLSGEAYLRRTRVGVYVADAMATLALAARAEAAADGKRRPASSGATAAAEGSSRKGVPRDFGAGSRDDPDRRFSVVAVSASDNPIGFLARHFADLAASHSTRGSFSERIRGRPFRFVVSTHPNRAALLREFRRSTANFHEGDGGVVVGVDDFSQTVQAICPDFVPAIVEFIGCTIGYARVNAAHAAYKFSEMEKSFRCYIWFMETWSFVQLHYLSISEKRLGNIEGNKNKLVESNAAEMQIGDVVDQLYGIRCQWKKTLGVGAGRTEVFGILADASRWAESDGNPGIPATVIEKVANSNKTSLVSSASNTQHSTCRYDAEITWEQLWREVVHDEYFKIV